MQELAQNKFERVVYLGSGPFKASRAKPPSSSANSPMAPSSLLRLAPGLRHGPKTFINARTLVVFVSNDLLTRKYDKDLVDELRRDGRAARVIEITHAHTIPTRDTLLVPA